MIYTDNFKKFEDDIFGVLAADPVMGQRGGARIEPGAPVSVVAAAVEKAVGVGKDGKVGLGWCVLPIEELIDDEPQVEFGPFKIPIFVDIVENVLLNQGPRGPKIPIRMLAAYAQKILKPYAAQNFFTDLVPENSAVILFTKHDDENLRVCRLRFYAYESDPFPFKQVDSPLLVPDHTVANVAGANQYPFNVTITDASAAEVWFTTDGSHPWSGNPAAKLWDGQSSVAITAPCLLRARGFNDPLQMVGSKCSSIYFA